MDIVPLTIWREARREGAKGMAVAAWVIRNRNETGGMWPKDPERICSPEQSVLLLERSK
jgi:hypothetical protein